MPPAMPPPTRDVVVVHSSDLHLDHDYTARLHGGDGTAGLAGVLTAARSAGADVVVLAGDTFDSHHLPASLLERAGEVIAAAALPVVLLPGNHDPAVADAVFRHGALADVNNLHVLGVTHDEAIAFPHLGLEVWGRAHRNYGDMIPFEKIRPRTTRWQIAVGHGHYVPVPDRTIRLRPAWLIGDDELAATGADYVALGHWNRAVKVGGIAYYSGSPEFAGTVNVVRLAGSGDVVVTRAKLDIAREPSASDEAGNRLRRYGNWRDRTTPAATQRSCAWNFGPAADGPHREFPRECIRLAPRFAPRRGGALMLYG